MGGAVRRVTKKSAYEQSNFVKFRRAAYHSRMANLVFNIRPAAASDVRNLSAHELHRAPDGNSAIDPSRSHLNRVLIGPQTQSEALDALYASGVQRPTAQAEAPYVQIVIGASGDFFAHENPEVGTFSANRVEQFERKALTWLKATFGNDLLHVSLHLDETTPHLHILIAPTYEKAARTPGRKKRGETDEAFEARKQAAAERPTLRTVGRRSNALLSAPNSFHTLRQSLADHMAPLGIVYGNDLRPTDPDPQTTRQNLKSENDYLRKWNAYEQKQAEEAQERTTEALRATQETEEQQKHLQRREDALAAREAALMIAESDLKRQTEWLARGAGNLEVAMRMAVSGQHNQEITPTDMADTPDKFEVLRKAAPDNRPTWGWRCRFWALHYSNSGDPVAERHLPAKMREALNHAFDRVAAWAKDIAAKAALLTAKEQKLAKAEQAADTILNDAKAEAATITKEAHRDAQNYGYLAESLETIQRAPQAMQQLALNFEAYQEVTHQALHRLGIADKRIDLFGEHQDKEPPPVLELVMDMAQRRAKQKTQELVARLGRSYGPGM